MVGTPQTTETATTETATTETATTALETLSHHRRRDVLQCLREGETPMSVGDLADAVAVMEYDATLAELSAETVERVHISLHHVHVPKLAETRHVEYSPGRDAVSLGAETESFERLRTYLEDGRSVTN